MNLINETEARERLHLPEHTLRRLRRLGQGPAWVCLQRRILYDIADLDAWVLSCTTTPQNTRSNHPNEGDNHV